MFIVFKNRQYRKNKIISLSEFHSPRYPHLPQSHFKKHTAICIAL